MLVYHFLPATYALDDLTKKHLKISQIDELNDPFELSCVAQPNRQIRKDLGKYRTAMAQEYGMLCFSKNWHNTVLWSHYADRHRGICLGFDVDDRCLHAVSYVSERPALSLPLTEDNAKQLLYTKYRDWAYEEELRVWLRIDTRDASTGMYFYDFDDKVALREVIAGPLCRTPSAEIEKATVNEKTGIRLIKARLAFKTFRVVENQRGFRD